MAWSIVSTPGSKLGPCAVRCGHLDCARARQDAAAHCAGCAEPIGYGKPWTLVDGQPWHLDCAEAAAR